MSVKNKNILEKITNLILDVAIVIFGIILLISIYNNVQVNILGNSYASFFGHSLFEVQTGSMGKAISPGDWIIVKYSDEINIKDIVTFEQDGEFITHRVIEAYKDTYVTKGDANNTKDDPITKEQIVGKVVKILPNFGILRKTLFNPAVLITSIITLYLIGFAFRKNKDDVSVKQNDDMKRMDDVMEKVFKHLQIFVKNIVRKVTGKKKNELSPSSGLELIQKEDIEEVKIVEHTVALNELTQSKNETYPEPLKLTESRTTRKLEEEDDLEKTLYFRMVSVDKQDIESAYSDNTYEEELEPEVVNEEPTVEEVQQDEDVIKKGLELLQKKKKKSKNIIEKAIHIKTEELSTIIDMLNLDEKYKANEVTIKETFLKSYVDAKYYNFCGDINLEYNGRNMNARIDASIKQVAAKLINEYKGSDSKFEEKVNKHLNYFTLLAYLDNAYLNIEDINEKREAYKNRILKHFDPEVITPQLLKDLISGILQIQKLYNGMLKYSLEKQQTNMFELHINPVGNKKIYGLDLVHNITFSKVYSDYIVDKTYSEGIIAEDKIAVLINLLLTHMVTDMYAGEFRKKYILYIPESLYAKDNKVSKIFKLLDDEYAKNNIIILLRYKELTKNKKVIKKLVKEGYLFAVDLEDTEEVKTKDHGIMELMTYIFVDKKMAKKTNVLATIPKELYSSIIYDEIATKVGNYWGEQ